VIDLERDEMRMSQLRASWRRGESCEKIVMNDDEILHRQHYCFVIYCY